MWFSSLHVFLDNAFITIHFFDFEVIVVFKYMPFSKRLRLQSFLLVYIVFHRLSF